MQLEFTEISGKVLVGLKQDLSYVCALLGLVGPSFQPVQSDLFGDNVVYLTGAYERQQEFFCKVYG